MTNEERTRGLVSTLFHDEKGEPIRLTKAQANIFEIIYTRKYPRVHLMAYTRFGKSLTVALAVLTRVATYPEKWAIIAPSHNKARIIMSYVIDHAFDNEYTASRLVMDKGETRERLRHEHSKNRLTFNLSDGKKGEVYVLSGDSRNKQQAGDALMGFGASNIVLDEAALVDDVIEGKVFRMLGDDMDNFYLKIGNPFKRNHFLVSCRDENYHRINIDYQIGLNEGRITPEFIEEARKKPNFSVLYENVFPEADVMDEKGLSHLILENEYGNALADLPKASWVGIPSLGLDVARGGGCENVWVIRYGNYAIVASKSRISDLMQIAAETVRIGNEYGVFAGNVCVDDNGVGGGVTDRLRQMGWQVKGVKTAESPTDERMFMNKRAENAWRLKVWLNQGGKLRMSDDWDELRQVKYKANESNGKMQLQSKIEMCRDGLDSPDTFDALALTFDTISTESGAKALQTGYLRDKIKRNRHSAVVY